MINKITGILRRCSRIQVFAACILLAIAWFKVFACLGMTCHPLRPPAAMTKTSASAAAPASAASVQSGTSAPAVSPARHARAACFGFRCPGAVTADTLIWFIASFFPATAILYALYNLLVRLREVEHAARVTRLYYLYSSAPANDADAWTQFQHYARARFWEYYNPWELMVFALSSGVLVVILAKLVIAKMFGAYLGKPLDCEALPVAFTAAAGLLGSTSGSMLFILRRYRTFNIYSFTYFQVLVAVAAGTFAGTFWHFMLAENVALFAAFAIAFLAALNIDYMVDLMIVLVARMTGQPSVAPPPSDLAMVIQNQDAIDVLKTISVFSVAEFINTDPMRLYLNLPQSIGAIDGWMDMALLRFNFPNQLDAFTAAGVRKFSQLLNRFAGTIAPAVDPFPHAAIQWRNLQPAELIPNVNMDSVFATVRDVAQSGRYDRQLAIISEGFCAGRFPPAAQ